MTWGDVVERTRNYVQEQFLYAQTDVRLSEDDLLFERGVVDSMGALELVQFLENEYEILIDDDEVTEQHFRSLRSIADYVCSKRVISAAT
jgi:acyl carrier protein